MRSRVALLVVILALAAPALAQTEAALKKAFEGREVTVLLDLPASHKGVDLYLQREPELDFADYAQRTKTFGISLRKEDRVMITTVKVNKKNIEVHLGGGGYGTWGDDNGNVSASYVGKSKREQDLEKERRRTADADRKRQIDRELGYLRDAREREERAARREAETLTAIKKQEIAVRRLDGGSRFNIWYEDKRLEKWAPTPDELMYSLAKYIDFGANGDGVAGVSRASAGNRLTSRDGRSAHDRQDGGSAALSLERGMSTAEVHDLLGRPTRRRTSTQGEFESVVETWETPESVTEVTFVGGVVVKFSASSK